ncbi:uncharacterized protein LOC136751744 [Amia ocellicauda]|uniref:uncharacterized protein LOC136751744 n=1 Tax=Amia ocellicauda TaxID=2972642 RepID=UPI0034649D49
MDGEVGRAGSGGPAGRVTVYSVPGCPHCRQASARLRELGLPLCEVDLDRNAELRPRVQELTGHGAVPQIFFNGVHVGGNEDLLALAPEELQRLVRMVRDKPVPLDVLPLPGEEPEEGEPRDGEFECERDDFADMIVGFKRSGVIGRHRRGLREWQHAVTGEQLVHWLQRGQGLDRSEALETAKSLMERRFFNPVSGTGQFEENSTLYRLVEHPRFSLNAGETAECSPVMAAELSEALRHLILKLYAEHLSPDGKSVDYKAMSQSPSFQRYCDLAVQLQRVELHALSREEKLAFFINIYNVLVIHGHLRLGSPQNVWQRYRFFNYVSYLIGGAVFTLQDIENGVLRGNRKGVAQLMKPFSKSDPRLQVALPNAEPLVHFALNCGAKGCPPIKTYTAKDIDRQLRTAAEAFLENDSACRVDRAKGEVRLSQIFKWYKVDFGDTDEKLLNWILNHMGDSPKKSSLEEVLNAPCYKVLYMPYDWSPNTTD